MRKESYEEGKKIGYIQTSAMLTELKRQEEFAFLKAVDSIALQQSLRDLDRSFVNFFQKRASYPTFKSKHNRFQSYRTVNQKIISVLWEDISNFRNLDLSKYASRWKWEN